MAGLPEIRGIGTIVADPELRFTQNGIPVASFNIAFNERKYVDGEWVDGDTSFLRCVAWRELAENTADTLTKGMRVIVIGDLRPNDYEADDGTRRYGFELHITEIGPSLRFATAKVIPPDREREAPATKTAARSSGNRRAPARRGSGK